MEESRYDYKQIHFFQVIVLADGKFRAVPEDSQFFTHYAFARALGDFGATLVLAGDTPGQTRTMPPTLYDAVLSGDTHTAAVFAALSAALCLTVCVPTARLRR